MRALESQIGSRLYDLGARAVELHRKNELHHSELDELFVDIEALQRELREAEVEAEGLMEELRRLRNAPPRTVCHECGATVKEQDRFCRHCGGSLLGD